MFISVNVSQLFICVFCETPLTFGDLSQRAAERCQPLTLEVKCNYCTTQQKEMGQALGDGAEHCSGQRSQQPNPQ